MFCPTIDFNNASHLYSAFLDTQRRFTNSIIYLLSHSHRLALRPMDLGALITRQPLNPLSHSRPFNLKSPLAEKNPQ